MTAEVLLEWFAIAGFMISTVALAVYGGHAYVLVFLFRRRQQRARAAQAKIIAARAARSDQEWPRVTSQIPLYNERSVASRVIEAVAAMDYPIDRHEIQVLDDSSDETRAIVDRTVARLRAQGFDVSVVRRADRKEFKAGALAHGLTIARGTYLTIFDADFVPPANFLEHAIPLLEDNPRLACLQGRWAHLNEHESWLTSAQALGIDGHFAVEQGARAWNGLLMNFNGTAGVWRKEAIEDPRVGGWDGETLTEDLDLSYRVQLAGWRIDYCLDLPCPAELPNTVNALKSQQRRWATGSIQVARKLLPRVWRDKGLTLGQKVEATLHLTHYSVALWMLILALIARPMLLLMAHGHPMFTTWLTVAWCGVLLSAIAPSVEYIYARHALDGSFSAIRIIPSMFVVGMGLCLNNAIAVVRGLIQEGGEFVRTPKSGSDAKTRRVSSDHPVRDHLWAIELLLGVYMSVSFAVYIAADHGAFSIFLLLYAVGFLVMGWCSRPVGLRRVAAARGTLNPAPRA